MLNEVKNLNFYNAILKSANNVHLKDLLAFDTKLFLFKLYNLTKVNKFHKNLLTFRTKIILSLDENFNKF